MPEQLSPQYDPTTIERPLYRQWEAAGLFTPHVPRNGEAAPYVIMMPPPNVTAVLHMGHGLNNTLQDTIIRFERMRGRNTLWLPGTDHAGIATQNVVEKLLAREGKTRFDIGREAFEARVWEHVRKTGPIIIDQLKAIGSSADWTRTYFTLDPALSMAVRETFVRLHQKGLIYRGKYIINWCPRCGTALSNEEAEKTETDGHLWHLQYPLADGSGSLTVATTRPETILGDTGVAVHPADARYQHLIGQQVVLPIVGRLIPIVADDAIDPEFGTGAVKVTPAHDPLDFEIGRRHNLAPIEVMQADGRMTADLPAPFANADRFAARKLVVAEFDRLGLLEKVEAHCHAVGHCYRCDTVVEPRLSEQWFVKMAPLARPALAAYRSGELRFIPERRGEEYAQWMENIRDWCISRQLWWGHRIPVWYCNDPTCGAMRVSRTDLTCCPACGGPVRQDEDVLDTWFSSWLVPMSSLGWPDEGNPDLTAFFPGTTLVTAPEILFFWVARMVMAGLEFKGALPFTTVYLHGTVRDTDKRKMSKSLGNGIDPLDVVERYGADALRYTIVAGMSVGTDLILDPEDLEQSFAPGRNFANKLWNAGRFLLGNLAGATRPLAGDHKKVIRRGELSLADRWIIARCDATVTEATLAYERFRLNDAAALVYHFIWSDLADWYIEQIKPRLYGDQPGGDVARAVACRTFEVALQLLHPVMPFITETLWRHLPGRADSSLATSPWPRSDRRALDQQALRDFGLVQELISAVRAIRAEYKIPPGQVVNVVASSSHPAFEAERGTIERLSKSKLSLAAAPKGPGASAVLSDGSTLFIALGDLVDLKQERARLGHEADRIRGLVEAQHKKLGNEQFVSRAPVEVVAKEREKLASWGEQLRALEQKLSSLGEG